MLDSKMGSGKHIGKAVDKVNSIAVALIRLMANIGRPSDNEFRL